MFFWIFQNHWHYITVLCVFSPSTWVNLACISPASLGEDKSFFLHVRIKASLCSRYVPPGNTSCFPKASACDFQHGCSPKLEQYGLVVLMPYSCLAFSIILSSCPWPCLALCCILLLLYLFPPIVLWPQPLFRLVSQLTHMMIYSLFDIKAFYPERKHFPQIWVTSSLDSSPNLHWLTQDYTHGLQTLRLATLLLYLSNTLVQHRLDQAHHLFCLLLYFSDCDDSRKSPTLCKWWLL